MTSTTSGNPAAARPGLQIVSFISQVGNIGRTSVVANVAWSIAGGGRRVLVLDWGTEGSGVADHLPFVVDTGPVGELLGEELDWLLSSVITPAHGDRPGRLTLTRHAPPDRTGSVDIVSPAAGVGRGGAMDIAVLGSQGDMLRRSLAGAYDHVLIDAPTAMPQPVLAQLARLSDTVAVCFPPRPQAIAEAAAITQSLTDRAAGPRVLAVATRIDQRDIPGSRRTRGVIRDEFGGAFGNPGQSGQRLDGHVVEIPYHPFEAHGPVLAVMFDRPGSELGLLPAYEQLTGAVTGGVVTAVPPVADDIRARYRRVLGLSTEPPEKVYLVYGAKDRAWADWIGDQVGRAGAEVRRLPDGDGWRPGPTGPRLIVVGAEHLSQSASARRIAEVAARDATAGRSRVVFVGISDHTAGEWADFPHVDLRGCTEARARGRLLTGLRMVQLSRPGIAATFKARFPAAPPRNVPSNLPPPNPAFVGRDSDLEEVRDRLLDADGVLPVLLNGDSGTGKSEIAREYAHRFARDYAFTWWIPAQDRQTVSASLATLAKELRTDPAGDPVSAVLADLESRSAPWLLVYDGVEYEDVLDGFLPKGGRGHVLITSRHAEVRGAAIAVDVGRLAPEDSLRLLRGHVHGLSDDDGRRLAEAGEHLPLNIRLIGAWMCETVMALEAQAAATSAAAAAAGELLSRMDRADAGHASIGWRPALARIWEATADTLGETSSGQLAIALVEMCAFLSPDGVGLRLLRSEPMMHALLRATDADPRRPPIAGDGDDRTVDRDGEDIAADAAEFDRVAWTCARFGLFEVDWGDGASVRMHRALQEVVRAGMPMGRHDDRQRQVLDGLASYTPTDADVEDAQRRIKLDELHKHLIPSGALEADERNVRRWVVNQVRHLYREGGPKTWPSAVELAEKVAIRWVAVTGPDDDLYLRLGVERANLLRALGRYEQAYELDRDILARQQSSLGVLHLRTLITARGLAGDLRGLGEFDEAELQDHNVREGFREALGDDHPNTLMATHNLALSSFLHGDIVTALTLEQEVLKRRERLFGPDDRLTLWSVASVGTYLRELGRYREAATTLLDAFNRAVEGKETSKVDELRIARSIAVTRRRMGDADRARQEHWEILHAYRQIYEDDHPDTRACQVALAADYHALGESEAAVDEARPCLAYYAGVRGEDHPFTALCRVNLAAFLHGAGSLDEALAMSAVARGQLEHRLGEGHPWLLAAEIVHANVLAAAGDLPAAEQLGQATLANCLDLLGVDHPCSKVALHNRDAEPAVRRDIDIDVPQT